jgi:hypothetical protein
MSDSFFQALIGIGDPLGLSGLGSNDSATTIFFQLSPGDTMIDLANALNVSVDSILTANPGLQADSPLSVNQVVDLPDSQIGQIMQSVNRVGNQAYVQSPSPSNAPTLSPGVPAPSSVPAPSPPSVSPATDVVHAVSDILSTVLPSLRTTATALDMSNIPQQNAPLPSPLAGQDPDRWLVSLNPIAPVPTPSAGEPSATPISTPPFASSVLLTTPVSTLYPGNATTTAFNPPQSENELASNFVQASNAAARTGQDRQRYPTFPPPMPIDTSRYPPATTTPVSNSVAFVQPAGAMNAMDLTTRNPMAVQLMALLMAQAGGPTVGGGAASVPRQVTPFIDPQALAALAVTMRGTQVIDLGAGRSLQFSLVDDRLGRINPIGQEDRATPRRAGTGLEEVRISCPDDENVEQTDEQREQGRRRRAAIAAMRRRRRMRSRRCRYWRGTRRDLHAARPVAYPKRVDLDEFRSRQPPRYFWNVDSGSR